MKIGRGMKLRVEEKGIALGASHRSHLCVVRLGVGRVLENPRHLPAPLFDAFSTPLSMSRFSVNRQCWPCGSIFGLIDAVSHIMAAVMPDRVRSGNRCGPRSVLALKASKLAPNMSQTR